jgi:hypothetical protein
LRRPAKSIATTTVGFSTVEMALTVAVILILGAIASPVLMKTLRVYQLNDSARRLADMVKVTRFEAIRNNRNADVRFQQSAPNWLIWKDSDTDGVPDPTEAQLVLGDYADMLGGAAVPNTAPIAATLGGGGALALSVLSATNGRIRFDSRGSVVFPGAPTVYVFFLGSATDSVSGYRAVLVMPAGSTQIWSSSSAGDWRRIS